MHSSLRSESKIQLLQSNNILFNVLYCYNKTHVKNILCEFTKYNFLHALVLVQIIFIELNSSFQSYYYIVL